MKRFLSAIALTCLLAMSASAGWLPTGGVMSPPPGDSPTGTTSPGNIPTSGFAEEVTDAARDALLSLLALVVV